MVRGSKYKLKDGTIRGFCSKCGKFYPLSKLAKKHGRFFCSKHNVQVRLKRRRRKEEEIFRY